MLKIKLSNGETVSVKPPTYYRVTLADGSHTFIRKKNESLVQKTINQISSRDYSNIYEDLNIDISDLGCIMINVEPIKIKEYLSDSMVKEIVEKEDEDKHAMGLVAESEAHVTLLYGLLENGNVWKSYVDELLQGWTLDTLEIDAVDKFDCVDYYAVVAHIKQTPELLEGHGRLQLLPHIDTFSSYQPHMTLAYVSKDANIDEWTKVLGNIYNGKTIYTSDINYGDLPETKEEESTENSLLIDTQEHFEHDCSEHESFVELDKATNALSDDTNNTVKQSQAHLQNAIQNLEGDMVNSMLQKINKQKNAFDNQGDVMSEADKQRFINELTLIFVTYYSTLFPIYANQLINKRSTEFGMQVPFQMNDSVTNYIKLVATRASQSHVNTIVNDILNTTKGAYDEAVNKALDVLKAAGNTSDAEIFKLAQEQALSGASLQTISSEIRKKYTDISRTRSLTIARTETNRAFTQSQYQADIQFLNSANLMDRAYKQWQTTSDKPCSYCIDLSMRDPIPFSDDFEGLGSSLTSTFYKKDGTPVQRTLQINYEALSAGNAHVNCACKYVLVIKNDKGEFTENGFTDLYLNFNPVHDKDGKFGGNGGGSKSFSSHESAQKYIDKQKYSSISSEEETAVGDYAGAASSNISYDKMNNYMRHGFLPEIDNRSKTTTDYSNKIRKNIVDSSNNLQKLISKNSVTDNLILYRIANTSTKLKVGDKFKDKGFVSTSIHDSGLPRVPRNGQVLKISAPKGTKGIFPEKMLNKSSTELEFLMNPSSFTVNSVEKGTITPLSGKKINVDIVGVSINV